MDSNYLLKAFGDQYMRQSRQGQIDADAFNAIFDSDGMGLDPQTQLALDSIWWWCSAIGFGMAVFNSFIHSAVGILFLLLPRAMENVDGHG